MSTSFQHIAKDAAFIKTRPGRVALFVNDARESFAHARVARTFLQRLVGLLNRKDLDGQDGILFMPGGSIHTFGMRFAIDVIFLDMQFTVLRIARAVAPWRCVRAPRGTRYVLELACGRGASAGVHVGTVIIALPK